MDISLIQKYINEQQLLNPKDKVIVGVSGGADSVALLDILCALGYECIVVHCNFHLRGDESNRDANHVRDLCKVYNLNFNSIDFDTEAYAKEKSISIEMAARDLRYDWFEKMRQKHDAASIAVAHHMDDSVETVLLNLIRGTGIRGLTGISPKNGYIIRPLLNISRQEIEDYLGARNIIYVNDSTNSEDIYTRNKIRLNILPMMETINPSVKNSINRTAQYLIQVQSIYQSYIASAKESILSDNKLDIKKLLKCEEPQAILYEVLSTYRFNSEVIDDIFISLDGESGKIFYSEAYRLLKDRDYLIIDEIKNIKENKGYTITEDMTSLSYPINLKISDIINTKDFEVTKSHSTLYLDKDKINYPLTIRRWKQGDWFVPFGMKGRKKVSDLFTDLKLNLFDKENIWILSSGDDILWIVGLRADDRYKINTETKNILVISLV